MKVAVLLSGGLDSATCLAKAVDEYGPDEVVAISAYYGQKHSKELKCAEKLAKHYHVKWIEINVAEIMEFSDSSLLIHSSKDIKQGPYETQTNGKDPVETYVPFRNGLFLSAGASIAMGLGAKAIWYGAHADDAAGAAYPDCSLVFVKKMRDAIEEGTAGQMTIEAPYAETNKAGVVKDGIRLGIPYGLTWSCYKGGEKPCGQCGTCIDRKRAFDANGIKDPLEE